MLQELKSNEFEKARSLFQGFDYSLSIHAAIEGNNPGRIFVDDVYQPRTALALTIEGYLLAGMITTLRQMEHSAVCLKIRSSRARSLLTAIGQCPWQFTLRRGKRSCPS